MEKDDQFFKSISKLIKLRNQDETQIFASLQLIIYLKSSKFNH